MSIVLCRACGSGSGRIVTVFDEAGGVAEEFCSVCQPAKCHEKFAAPSDKKIWIGPEYAPNDYEKRYDSEGVYYMPKPEVAAARERRLFVDTDEEAKYAAAVEKKRMEGRKTPLTPAEVEEALRRADAIIRPMIEDKETTYLV